MNAEVIQNILARNEERRAGQLAPARLKTALVFQGGTLRSITNCAAGAALNRLGLTNAFDSVYGISSGSINAAYFLTGQCALGVSVYAEDVNNRRFINLWRFKKILDLEYLFEEIVLRRKKHNHDALINHPTELKVIASDAETGEGRWFSSKDPAVNIYTALKASCALPFAYPKGVQIGGRTYVDGFVTEPIPISDPLNEGHTDILVLMTQHISYRETDKLDLMSRFVFEPFIRKQLRPQAYARYRNRWKLYNRAAGIIEAGVYRDDGREVRITYVCPDAEVNADSYEIRRERLLAAAYSSWKNTFEAFGVADGASRAEFDGEVERAKQVIAAA